MGVSHTIAGQLIIRQGTQEGGAGMAHNEIGVYMECTGFGDPVQALPVIRELGLELTQVSQLPSEFYSEDGARRFRAMLQEAGVRAAATTIAHDGEEYDDWPTVRRTVGYVPQEFRASRVAYSHRVIDFTAAIGCRYVTTHIGEPPHDTNDPEYAALVDLVRELGQHCADVGLRFGLETGQETGRALMAFVGRVGLDNVGVNFDPANIVLYGADDPLSALDEVAPRLFGAHCKDGLWPAEPEGLGTEVLAGQGEAKVCACVRKLVRLGYEGPIIMEIGAGPDRREALRQGKAFLEECLADVGP